MKKGLFGLICCFFLIYLFPSAVTAHASILKSLPSKDSELQESPQEIRVQFTEEVDTKLSRLLLYDEQGNQLLTTQSSEENNWMVLHIPELENGIYKVVWQILAGDTHVTEGSFHFTVNVPLNAQAPAAAANSEPVPVASDQPPEPTVEPTVYNETQSSSGALPGMPMSGVAQETGEQSAVSQNKDPLIDQESWNLSLRILEIITAVTISGWVFLRNWIFGGSKENVIATWFNPKTERVVISAGILLFLLAGCAHVYLLSKHFSGTTIQEITRTTGIGQVSWIRPLILFALLLTTAMKASKARTGMQFILLGGLMFTFPLTGHAASGDGALTAIISHAFHMLTAAVWFGGLLSLFSLSFVKNKDASLVRLLNHSLIRFSAVALPMFILVSLSGVVLALYRLNSWADFTQSAYGRILLWKIAFVSATFLVAVFHRFIMIPKIKRLAQAEIKPSRPNAANLFYGIQVEMVLAEVLLILAGVLSTGSPP